MKNIKKYSYFLLLGVVFLVAVLLRVTNFRTNPPSLYIDEMAMLVDAKSIVETGTDIHGVSWLQPIFLSYGDFKQPVYIWLTSVAVGLLGSGQWVVRVPSLLAGLATILVAPLIALELWRWQNFKHDLFANSLDWYAKHKWLALAVASVVAVSPWSITFSRAGFEGHLAQAFLGLGIYTYLISARQKKWLILSVILLAISTYTYFSVRFVAPVVLLTIGVVQTWHYWQLKPSKQRSWHSLISQTLTTMALPIIGFGLLLLPQFLSPHATASNQLRLSTDSVLNNRDQLVVLQNTYRELAGNTVLDRIIFHRDWLLIKELGTNYSDFLRLDYVFLNGDANLRHGTGAHGLFLLPFLPMFLYGVYVLLWRRRKMGLVLFIWWLVALLPAAIPNTTPHALRSLNALIPLSIIIGLGLFEFGKYVVQKWDKWAVKAISISWVIWLLLAVFEFNFYYQNIYKSLSAEAWSLQEEVLVEKALELQTENRQVYFWQINPQLFLWIMGQPSYSEFPIHDPSWDSNRLKVFDVYHIDEGMADEIPNVDRAVLVLPAETWRKLVAEYDPKIWQEFNYDAPNGVSYVVAVTTPHIY